MLRRCSMTIDDLILAAGLSIVFHYTNVQVGEWIVEDRLFATGGGAVYGTGLYATHIAPEDAQSVETIIVHCFGGDATPPEVSYGIALAITDGLPLVRRGGGGVAVGAANAEARPSRDRDAVLEQLARAVLDLHELVTDGVPGVAGVHRRRSYRPYRARVVDAELGGGRPARGTPRDC